MQYCTIKNTACELPPCKHGEELKGVRYNADDHELSLDEMTPEQRQQFWKEGRRFFEPRNPRWEITTDKRVYSGTGKGPKGKIVENCDEWEEK
ncbi:MAG: hypothetical protein PHG06_00265 [Parabacteroides sp.]|nr:hypothetical protein [Parabacteroides sp.]